MKLGTIFRASAIAIILAAGASSSRAQASAVILVAGPDAQASALPPFGKEAPYADFRKRLISLGWQPKIPAKRVTADQSDYPETLACAGTGEGNCLFLWKKGRMVLEVSTIDDPPVIVALRCRSGCRKAR